MKKELGEFIGKTVEDALQEAVKVTGFSKEDLEVEVLEKGRVTFLGIGSIKAKIKVFGKEKETDGERAVKFLQGLFEIMSLHAIARLKEDEEKTVIEIDSEKSEKIIGKRGSTLDALQSLAGAVANIGRDDYKRVVVDCENYRQKREETLCRVAKKTAEKAVRQGRKISLEPMSAYERRIIHAALADNTDVKTFSEGKEPYRFIVIAPNEIKPFNKEKNNSYRNGKGNKGKFNRGEKKERRQDSFKKSQRHYSEEEKRERSRVSGGTGMGTASNNASYKKSSSFVFGTYLGNSLKDEEQSQE